MSRPTGRVLLGLAKSIAQGIREASSKASPVPGHGSRPIEPVTGTAPGVDFTYSPHPDGRPHPGEIVWTWVPYEEDATQGKDRPVLLIGRRGPDLLALQLTSKDHDRDAAQEASWGRYWMDIGSGDWDHQRRPSEVRLDRLIVVDPDEVRREGAVLAREIFESVAEAASAHWASEHRASEHGASEYRAAEPRG